MWANEELAVTRTQKVFSSLSREMGKAYNAVSDLQMERCECLDSLHQIPWPQTKASHGWPFKDMYLHIPGSNPLPERYPSTHRSVKDFLFSSLAYILERGLSDLMAGISVFHILIVPTSPKGPLKSGLLGWGDGHGINCLPWIPELISPETCKH